MVLGLGFAFERGECLTESYFTSPGAQTFSFFFIECKAFCQKSFNTPRNRVNNKKTPFFDSRHVGKIY